MGGKFLGNLRVHKPSECRGTSTNKPDTGDKGSSSHKRLKLAKVMETFIQYSYESEIDGDDF